MKQYNFAEYEIIKENNQDNNLFRIIGLIFIIGIILVLYKFNFSIYQESILLKNDNSYLIIADIDMVDTLSANKKIIINNKQYNYRIINVGDYTNIDGTIYQPIYLDILNYNSKIGMIKCQFLKNKTTLINSLIKFIKGG